VNAVAVEPAAADGVSIITPVTNAGQSEPEVPPRGTTNGTRFGAGNYRRTSMVNVLKRHTGVTVTHRVSSLKQIETKDDDPKYSYCSNDMDSHADTCCAGLNFRMLVDTGDRCDVQPYSDHYDPMVDIPVATVATICNVGGVDYILVFHETLFFGKLLDFSLINPNQLRHAGVSVQDDYTRDEPFGITVEDVFIPFDMEGTTIRFGSVAPTGTQISELRHLVMTRQEKWNPDNVKLRVVASAMTGAVQNQSQRRQLQQFDDYEDTPVVLCTDCNIDKRIVASIRVQSTRSKSAATVTSTERHTKVTAEILSRM